MRRRTLMSLLALSLAAMFGACDSDTMTGAEESAAEVPAAVESQAPSPAYRITIENLTNAQWFTPPLVATHAPATDVFEVGQPAPFGVKEIAENGNLAPLTSALQADPYVAQVVHAATPAGPLGPGMSVTFGIEGAPEADRLSIVSMLICTNDGFTGVDAGRLPRRVGQTVQGERPAWDAGTEINTEDFADLVPPCPQLTGFPSEVPGSGVSDPALAEGGVIHLHQGIAGGADLDPSVHGFSGPVMEITVTRVR